MWHGRMIACSAVMAMTLLPASAQDVEHYQLERTQDGYVRLDTVTGRMTLCTERDGQLVCRMAAEDRSAYDNEIDALQGRVDALEARITALEGGTRAPALSDDQEFERTMGYMERFFRRFMGIVKDLERDFGSDQPQPDRT